MSEVFVSHRVLEAGGWIEIRDPRTVTERARRPLMKMAMAAVRHQGVMNIDESDPEAVAATLAAAPEVIGEFENLNDALIIAMLTGWSFDVPITMDDLLDLPTKTYQEIQTVIAPLITIIMPNFEPTPDAASPTVASNESVTPSLAAI